MEKIPQNLIRVGVVDVGKKNRGDLFMLYDSHLEYSLISKDEFESNLELIASGDAKIINSIKIFLKNKNTNEIRMAICNTERDELSNYNLKEWQILVKYYIKRIKVYDPYKFHFQEIGDAYYIYNLGYLYISDFYKAFEPKEDIKIKELFIEYDKKYTTMMVPFTDDEFLISK